MFPEYLWKIGHKIKRIIEEGASLEFITTTSVGNYNEVVEILKNYSIKPEQAKKWWLENEDYLKKFPEDRDKSLHDFLFEGDHPFLNDVVIIPIDRDGNIMTPPDIAVYKVSYNEPEKSGLSHSVINSITKRIYDGLGEENRIMHTTSLS